LENYLPIFYTSQAARIIILNSTTKPNTGTHRNSKYISTVTEEDVLVSNGLKFSYYDTHKSVYVTEIRTSDGLACMLTHTFSEEYTMLQRYMFRPHHAPNGLTPNHVINGQSNCPEAMTMEEYKSMASLPIGFRLQWLSILRQLQVQAINLSKTDTVLLMLQISCQVGPSSENHILRDSHQELSNEAFSLKFLDGLRSILQEISANLKSYSTVLVLALLSTRILSVTKSNLVTDRILDFLSACRSVAMQWIRQLQDELAHAQDDQRRIKTKLRIFEVALICIRTSEMNHGELEIVLDTSEAAILIECTVLIHNLSTSSTQRSNTLHAIMLQVWRRVMHTCCPILRRKFVEAESADLDIAIRKSWPAFVNGGEWTSVTNAGLHWIMTQIIDGGSAESLTVHFDLLTGELLVDGLPLARLPSRYETCAEYRPLFCETVLEVMKSNVPGMSFSAVKEIYGYTIHLGIHTEYQDELLLLACRSAQKIELVPARLFENIMPRHFSHDFFHWYDHHSGTIEFRPTNRAWQSLSSNWTLKPYQNRWKLEVSGETLISTASATA
jgi:hypothetical protein